jgi:cytoskeletal protein RodZ
MRENMTQQADQPSESFGQYLQGFRTGKRISLETVAEETRIRLETLQQIEEEDHENLPDEVFVKGFLRAYAAAVGADGAEAVRRYQQRLSVHRKVVQSEAALLRSTKKFWMRLLLSLGALAVLIVVSILAFTLIFDQAQPPPAPAVEAGDSAAEVSKTKAETIEAPLPETETNNSASKQPPERLLLRVNTIEETWLKIIIDDLVPREYSLYPGDRIELEAGSGYNLLIGNAGGVEIYLNDQPVAIPGKSGEVVNLELP